jgi:hypothetical protein
MNVRAMIAGQRVRLVLLRRRLGNELARDRARALGFLGIGVGVAVAVFALSFGGAWWAVQQRAPQLVFTGTIVGLTGLAVALVFSSLGHAAQAFFSAKDLWLWESAPTGVVPRFVDRFTETALAATPPTLALGSIAIAGLQLGGGGGLVAAARAVVAVALVSMLPVAAGVILAHVGGALLPAGRLRRLSLVILGVGLTGALVWFRHLRVERLLSEQGAAELLGAAQGLTTVGPAWGPPRQLALFVVEGDLTSLVLGVTGVALTSLLALGAHALMHDRARKLAVDEAPTGVVVGSWRARALDAVTQLVGADIRPLVQKDLLAFTRDPGQWGQVILLVGVGVLYVVNVSVMGEGFEKLIGGQALIASLHVGIVAFIAGGLAARFAFPQLGLEGPAVWIIDGAPISWPRLLRAKWLVALPLTALFPTALGLVGGVVLDFGVVRTLWTSALIGVVSCLFAGLGVARGASKPLFDAASLSELAMGPGAITTVVQSTVSAGVFSVATLVVEGIDWAITHGRLGRGLGIVVAVGVVGAPLVVLGLVVRQAMRDGVAGLLARRLEGSDGPPRTTVVERVESLD